MNDKRVNLLYPGYKEYVLDNIKDFVRNFDCDGTHLDYIRYGHFVYSFDKQSLKRASSLGCDTTRLLSFFQTEANYKQYATNSGFVDLYKNNDPDVVKWVEMRNNIINEYIVEIKEAINNEKPDLTLSASFMPDGVTDPKYANVFYAQDYALNAATLDRIIPMAYFKAYGKPTNWLKTITETAKQLVGDKCDIYTGVQGYDGVTANQLNEQIQFSISGGADGVAIFRYETIPADGRIIYLGAGTGGRLSVLDVLELPTTYGMENGMIDVILAGGVDKLVLALEEKEDDTEEAWKSLQEKNISEKDIVVGISASGSTPFVLEGLKKCRENGITTCCIVNNPDSPISEQSDYPVEIITGPEYVTGSTRMKAGTSQKMTFDMISTTVMIQMGRVLDNSMWNVQLINHKITDRAIKMLMEKAMIADYEEAKNLLLKHGSVKEALDKIKK